MDLKETEILGSAIDTHWYYQAKARAMLSLLGKGNIDKVLDVGAGAAFFSKYLLRHAHTKEVTCVDIGYSSDIDGLEFGKKILYRRAIGHIDANLVLLMDVLEHVDSDVALLRDYVAKVPKGTRFLITVPAFSFLWSEHDDYLEHKRRYTLRMLEDVTRACSLKIERSGYIFGSVFPIALLTRLIGNLQKKPTSEPKSQLKVHHPLVNKVLASLCALEFPLIKYNRVFGLSVYCVAISR